MLLKFTTSLAGAGFPYPFILSLSKDAGKAKRSFGASVHTSTSSARTEIGIVDGSTGSARTEDMLLKFTTSLAGAGFPYPFILSLSKDAG
jgi:hypothetical protein